MSPNRQRARMLKIPADHSLVAGRLDGLRLDTGGQASTHVGTTSVVVDYHELRLSAPAELHQHDGALFETFSGLLIPRRIRFIDVEIQRQTGLLCCPIDLPEDHPGRFITYTLHWRTPEGQRYHLLSLRADQPSTLLLTARRVETEARTGPETPITATRDWSPVPDSPARWVPEPVRLHQHYGGDPVSVCLDGRSYDRLLFIGGVDVQDQHRPDVQAVLNLGEDPSKWLTGTQLPPADRWVDKGEGRDGMRLPEIVAEARWVIDRLAAGERVLVHCSAGMNRSATICCAVLILLEGLSAEAALERVRQHHPWARPDPFHWLNLRWLAHTRSTP